VEVLGIIDEPVVDGWPLLLVRTHDADGQISLRRRTLKRAGELARGATVLVTRVDRNRRTFVLPLGGYKNIGWVLKWYVRGRELPAWRRGRTESGTDFPWPPPRAASVNHLHLADFLGPP
jgi:hypothetical protein